MIKAKLPYIRKKDASNVLIFSTRFFLQEFKLQKLSALQKPLETQPTGHIRVIAEAKAITWVFWKRAEVMLGEMQHLLCKLENAAALQQKARRPPKVRLRPGLQVSWTSGKFLNFPFETSNVKKKIFYVVAESTLFPRNLKSLKQYEEFSIKTTPSTFLFKIGQISSKHKL